MRFALVTCRSTPTNEALVDAGELWEQMTPKRVLRTLRPGDVALGRLDVLPTLDGATTVSGRSARSPPEASSS